MVWFIDFDDTLAVGPITFAFEHVIPNLIKQHALPHDEALFSDACLEAQRQGNANVDPQLILNELFGKLGWPHELKNQFLNDIFTGYVPTLFEDAKSFLEQLQADSQKVYILSNNNQATALAGMLGITPYFAAILTPDSCGKIQGKPDRAMWDYATAQYSIGTGEPIHMVGDDPWSDGTFAETCQMDCWMLDRMNRYSPLYSQKNYHWVRSLKEIPITKA